MAWKFGLIRYLNDKGEHLFSDSEIVIINDKYPKSEAHYLVLPKQNIHSIKDVNSEHLELLKKMYLKGREFAEENGGGRSFRYGYHAEPSMDRLHLHVISNDFNSPSLKKKLHWNSFNTPFFIDSFKAISDVESIGKVKLPSPSMCKEYLRTKLKCNKCDFMPENLPSLKKHIVDKHLN